MKLITKHVSFKYKYDILATQENSGFSEKKNLVFWKRIKEISNSFFGKIFNIFLCKYNLHKTFSNSGIKC